MGREHRSDHGGVREGVRVIVEDWRGAGAMVGGEVMVVVVLEVARAVEGGRGGK